MISPASPGHPDAMLPGLTRLLALHLRLANLGGQRLLCLLACNTLNHKGWKPQGVENCWRHTG